MMMGDLSNKGYSQRQLRVGELVKQSLENYLLKMRLKSPHLILELSQ